MNVEEIKRLAERHLESFHKDSVPQMKIDAADLLELIAELERLKLAMETINMQQFELMGVIIDVEQGHGFDEGCLNTIKRVRGVLVDQTKGTSLTPPAVTKVMPIPDWEE